MTHVTDLYEPGDDREPSEPEPEFLDPEELIEAIDDPQARATVEALLADVRYLRGLEIREEWAVTGGPNFPAEPSGAPISPDKGVIAYVNRHETARLWRRILTVHPWEPIAPDAPF